MNDILNKDNAIALGVVVTGVLLAGGLMSVFSGNQWVAKSKAGYGN